MVSKEQYYARKEAGLCTKCGGSREGSPSQARCLPCHNKLKTKDNAQAVQIKVSPDLNDNFVPPPTTAEKADSLKQNRVIEKAKEIKVCQRCGDTPLSFNLICQKCLKIAVFTKYDAIARYGNCCSICGHLQLEDLKIVSKDISKPLKHKDQELYKVICYRKNPPAEYTAQCHSCYWKQNMSYLRELKKIFESDGIFEENFFDDEDEDIVDI